MLKPFGYITKIYKASIMKIIGIVGGIGSGKSTVARYMEQDLGACLIEVDKIIVN